MSELWPGWSGESGALLASAEVPEWMRQLAEACAELDPAVFRRFSPPPEGATKRAAVLMVLGGQPDILLQLRADTLGAHAGQVSFPGGGAEPGDADPVATALRETEEEVGVPADAIRPIAVLPSIHVPVSGFRVSPVLAHWTRDHPVRAIDQRETVAVARIPIGYLTDPANRCSVRVRSGYVSPAFLVPGMLVWGFTAALLTIVLNLGGWDSEWDTGDIRELEQAWEAARAMPPLTGRVQA